MVFGDYNTKGALFVVATPIGNLGDITFRAVSILREVDRIVCEDTRETTKIIKYLGIPKKPFIVFNAHSKEGVIKNVIEGIASGEKLALVTDAGTPAISDPGSLLVDEIRKYFEAKKEIAPIFAIPGPSALISALSISGFPSSEFLFLGFLPHKKGRQTLFQEIKNTEKAVVFYESPHRIMKTLESLGEVLKDDRKLAICRELTKIYEEVFRGTPKEAQDYFLNNPDKIRGEFVVVVSS